MSGRSIDDIIGSPKRFSPYANSQPSNMIVPNLTLQRIPPLATTEGINPEFQIFFDGVVDGVLKFIHEQEASFLHNVSDNAIVLQDFQTILKGTWGETCSELKDIGPRCTGIDVELNMDRFEDIHRNLIGGFNIMAYCLRVKEDEFSNTNDNSQVTEFVKVSTELLFTYKEERFQILSRIQPFKKEVI